MLASYVSLAKTSLPGIATSFLPFCNGVVAFEADLNNVRDNAKAAETFDCRMSTLDLYSGLCKYGIQLDMDAVIETFKDAPLDSYTVELRSLAARAACVVRQHAWTACQPAGLSIPGSAPDAPAS